MSIFISLIISIYLSNKFYNKNLLNIYNKTMKVYKIENDSSAKKFSKMLKKGEWLVFYYADWCGHCNSVYYISISRRLVTTTP